MLFSCLKAFCPTCPTKHYYDSNSNYQKKKLFKFLILLTTVKNIYICTYLCKKELLIAQSFSKTNIELVLGSDNPCFICGLIFNRYLLEKTSFRRLLTLSQQKRAQPFDMK